jgi:hypothetical protein
MMKKSLKIVWHPCTLAVFLFATWSSPGVAADSEAVKAQFANPPKQYSTGPLWTWNDLHYRRASQEYTRRSRRPTG